MTATQNNFLGPAALIFSCSFPATTGSEAEVCGLGASHEFAHVRSLPSEDCDGADTSFFNRVRSATAIVCGGRSRSGVFGGTTLRVF